MPLVTLPDKAALLIGASRMGAMLHSGRVVWRGPLPVLTVTDGTITTFTRGGVDYTQVIWRQGGSFTLSDEVSMNVALVGGGGSGGQQNLAPGGGGASSPQLFNDVPLPGGNYSVVIGAGGAGAESGPNKPGNSGSPSELYLGQDQLLISPGGGAGGGGGGIVDGAPGGNGGGGAGSNGSTGFGGAGDPGNDGGDAFNSATSADRAGGGGGGAGSAGQDGTLGIAGNGGPGVTLTWTEPPMDICGGGGGSSSAPSNGAATHGGTPGARGEPSADAENGGGSGGSTAGTGKGGDGLFVLVVRSDEVVVEMAA